MTNKRAKSWVRLDNAAKYFASTQSKRDTKVFRFACELVEPVDCVVLDQALKDTIEAFPIYRYVLKRGLFWYYFEESDLPIEAKAETLYPCAPLYDSNVKTLLFRVTYYKNRINLEVFHALSDGTGAMDFLRMLVYNYLVQKHGLSPAPVIDYDVSLAQRMDDSFLRYYRRLPKSKEKTPSALQIRGAKLQEYRIGIWSGVMPVKQVLELARRFNTTVTILLVSVLILSILRAANVRERRKPVCITVPVNLRNYFDSGSARNFFGTVSIPYQCKGELPSLEELIPEVAGHLAKGLTPEAIERRMNGFSAIEHNLLSRIAPLAFKDLVLRIASYGESKKKTAALSNLGKIQMPEELSQYIRLFDVFVATNTLQICMCSYGENMVVSYTSPLTSTDIQKNFFRALSAYGVDIDLNTNLVKEE